MEFMKCLICFGFIICFVNITQTQDYVSYFKPQRPLAPSKENKKSYLLSVHQNSTIPVHHKSYGEYSTFQPYHIPDLSIHEIGKHESTKKSPLPNNPPAILTSITKQLISNRNFSNNDKIKDSLKNKANGIALNFTDKSEHKFEDVLLYSQKDEPIEINSSRSKNNDLINPSNNKFYKGVYQEFATEQTEPDENTEANYEYYDEDYDYIDTNEESNEQLKDPSISVNSEKPINNERSSIVTTKTIVNESTVLQDPITSTNSSSTKSPSNYQNPRTKDEEHSYMKKLNMKNSVNNTENYVVVASIQASRSSNGARFLHFPAIEQEETKRSLSELDKKIDNIQNTIVNNNVSNQGNLQGLDPTESIIDKLDRVQSELSSGLLTGKFPILSESNFSTSQIPNIEKFVSDFSNTTILPIHSINKFKPEIFRPFNKFKQSIPTINENRHDDQYKLNLTLGIPNNEVNKTKNFQNSIMPFEELIKNNSFPFGTLSNLLPSNYNFSKETKLDTEDKTTEQTFIEHTSPISFVNFHKKSSTIINSTMNNYKNQTELESAKPEKSGGVKLIFPKGIHKRIGINRLTTPRTNANDDTHKRYTQPIVIKKGLPVRATTEFTGWPTPSTTPYSVKKIFLQSNLLNENDTKFLIINNTSSTTPAPVITSKPTRPTTTVATIIDDCTTDCNLAATIKIINGVLWTPEYLDHNTVEWKTLAKEMELQLKEIFKNAPYLKNWYKTLRIDSFSKGSVLVDYYVELSNISQKLNTLNIKQLFLDSLIYGNNIENIKQENDSLQLEINQNNKQKFKMGKYIIDPEATYFSAMSLTRNIELEDKKYYLPQWAIIIMFIGAGSLIFVIICGISVIINRRKRATKNPVINTQDRNLKNINPVHNYNKDLHSMGEMWNKPNLPIRHKMDPLKPSNTYQRQLHFHQLQIEDHEYSDVFTNAYPMNTNKKNHQIPQSFR